MKIHLQFLILSVCAHLCHHEIGKLFKCQTIYRRSKANQSICLHSKSQVAARQTTASQPLGCSIWFALINHDTISIFGIVNEKTFLWIHRKRQRAKTILHGLANINQMASNQLRFIMIPYTHDWFCSGCQRKPSNQIDRLPIGSGWIYGHIKWRVKQWKMSSQQIESERKTNKNWNTKKLLWTTAKNGQKIKTKEEKKSLQWIEK